MTDNQGRNAPAGEDRFHTLYRNRLLDRVRLMMGPRARRIAESSDFVAEVFVAIYKDRAKVDAMDDDDLLRWMTAVARNRIRGDIRRKRERALESISVELGAIPDTGTDRGPSSVIDGQEHLFRLTEALESLEPDHREVIVARDLQGLPWAEIAERMGRSEGAVQMLRTRAVIHLGRLLARKP